MSAIVYMGDDGGPTLLIGLSPSDSVPGVASERCWRVWPHAGQAAVFSGHMLHGILPMLPAQVDPSRDPELQLPFRQTILFNLWTRCPRALHPLPRVISPRMPLTPLPERSFSSQLQPPSPIASAPGGVREPPIDGQVRYKMWPSAHESDGPAWRSTELILGMFDRSESWTVELPPSDYSGVQLEAFESKIAYIGSKMEPKA